MPNQDADIAATIRRHVILGWAVLTFLVVGLGGWAASTELSGAVVSPGVLVVESNVKKVQHPTGGIIGEIHVQDGAKVRAGDLLLRLDETVTRSNLAIVVKSLDEFDARQARLKAERDDQATITFPAALLRRASDPQVGDIVQEEQKLFDIRSAARAGQKAQLREKIGQLGEELQGLLTQATAKGKEIELINRELEGVRDLWNKSLIPIAKLIALEREAVRIEGERGQTLASSAQVKGKVTETRLQIDQIDQDLRSEVAKEMREIQGKTAELIERKVAADDQLRRIDIRAPQDGTVLQLSVHTIGGVINAGEQLMLIVPDADQLMVELKLPPQSIDQVAIGQVAALRFSAFNQRTTPELTGRVTAVAADVTQDAKTGLSYYLARVAIAPDELAKLGGRKLIPGMPVEAFVQTSDRTVLSFLMKPLSDQIAKTFREQ
jgi:HlyD family secretion protein